MKPPSLARASAVPSVQPLIGAAPPPPLAIPLDSALPTLEATARAYASEHAALVGCAPSRLAVAAFNALCRHHGLIARPLLNGRWTSHPPAPGVDDARARLSCETPQRTTEPPFSRTPAPAPF